MKVVLEDLSVKEIDSFIKDNLEEIIIDPKNFIKSLINDPRKSVNKLGFSLEKEIKKRQDEFIRVKKLYDFDKAFNKIVCGVDEVGRGPLAGPIVSAAVILKTNSLDSDLILGLNDSKKISKKNREKLDKIIKKRALDFSIYEISNKDIDRYGISQCNNEAFKGAIRNLTLKPDLVLSDGYRVKGYPGENIAIVKGDYKSASIAAASIIAKVYRDNLMEEYGKNHKEYGFETNSGYGSKEHISAIKKYGKLEIHRESFIKNIIWYKIKHYFYKNLNK